MANDIDAAIRLDHPFLAGGGELGALIARFDWRSTSLGPLEAWPQSLKTTVGLVLRSHVPMVTLWGRDGIMIYNDAFCGISAGRHPRVLGSRVREGWPEFAAFNDHVLKVGLAGGVLSYKDQELTLHRNGRPEQVWMDLDYSPVLDEAGAPCGVIAIVVETTEKVRDRRELERSEAEIRVLAQAMPNQVWTARPDGRLDWFNDQVYAYSGAKPGDLDAEGWLRGLHADDIAATVESWTCALKSGEVHQAEFRLRGADGAYRWHLSRATPIRDAEGRICRWVGANTDIHERKVAEAAHARDRDRMWTLTHDLMLVCDLEGVIRAVNPSATRLLGWSAEQMVGHELRAFLHPQDEAATMAERARISEGTVTLGFENRYLTRNGDYRLLAWSAVLDGGFVHAVGRDITAERAIARDQERLWTLSPVLQVVTDVGGLIAKVNPIWRQVLGWSEAQTVGRAFLDLLAPESREAGEAAFRRLAAGEAMGEQQLVFVAEDGGPRYLAWTLVREGETVYGFGSDMTDQRATEEALRQSQKMDAVGQLTGGIAHDFNNLLQGITGSLDLVQKRISQGRIAELDRFIKGAMMSANRATALTHRLLAFSRRQPLDPRPVGANPLVASMEDLLRRTLGEGIELELVLGAGLWPTRCDANQLESAILNLAINARDAMPDGGKLVIETANAQLDAAGSAKQGDMTPGQYVCISVADTGIGMTAETIARAFEPFFTTKPIGQGTGLGLSMIYGFARQSEGYAKISSEPGKGTAFKLYLPRTRGASDEDPASPAAAGAGAAQPGQTVLVVEDEPVVRSLVVEVLTDLGYRVIEAGDGLQGLEALQSSRKIDLLVTDVGLPGLNGRQMADAGRTLRPGLKVLFMTGYAENTALASGFLEPGMTMMTKPFAMEVLAARVREIIQER